MPSLKPYQRRQTIPGVSGAVQQRSAGQVGQAISLLGAGISDIGNVLAERRELLNRQDLENQRINISDSYDDDQRIYRDGELKKTGQDSYDNIERGQQWVDDQIKKHTADITNPELKSRIANHISTRSRTMLDEFSRHQTVQRSFVSKQARDNSLKGIMKDGYFNHGTLDENQARFIDVIKGQVDVGILGKEEAADIIVAGSQAIAESQIEGLINTDPEAAVALFEAGEFNQYLPPKKLLRLEKEAKARAKAAAAELKRQEKETREQADRAKKEAAEAAKTEIQQNLTSGTLSLVDIQKAPISADDKEKWKKRLSVATTSKIISDTEARADLATRINTNPDSVSVDEIWEEVDDKKLSTEHAQSMSDKLRQLQKEGQPESHKRAWKRVDKWSSQKLFSSNKKKNIQEWSDAGRDLQVWIDEHPDKDPNEWLDGYLNPKKENRVIEWFNDLIGVEEAPEEVPISFDEKPPAADYAHQYIVDSDTGQHYFSDGKTWSAVNAPVSTIK